MYAIRWLPLFPAIGDNEMVKRLIDILVASVALAAFSPLMVLVWVAIKLDDGGPALFRQTRIGRGGLPFEILKFRSMQPRSSLGPAITRTGDPRVTRPGRWLRRTKLDELPQLWNVLRGEMSLVGPRPEVPKYVELYSEAQREVLKLRPGITDEASIAFRNEEQMLADARDPEQFYIDYCLPKKIAINLDYARNAGPLRDLQVIARTIRTVWLGL